MHETLPDNALGLGSKITKSKYYNHQACRWMYGKPFSVTLWSSDYATVHKPHAHRRATLNLVNQWHIVRLIPPVEQDELLRFSHLS